MADIKVRESSLPGVKIIEPVYFEDFRGYFCETYSRQAFAKQGLNANFVQDNHSLTVNKGTIRGIHYQNSPKAQLKLVRCTRGQIRDFAVDLRRDSPTFKQWVSVELSEANHRQLWIPAGFGHAFLTLQENCEVQYKVDELYDPQYDRGIAWNDPEIAIDWGIDDPILSEKDKNAPVLSKNDLNLFVSKER